MYNKLSFYAITIFLLLLSTGVQAQKTESKSVTTNRITVNGKLIEDKTTYDSSTNKTVPKDIKKTETKKNGVYSSKTIVDGKVVEERTIYDSDGKSNPERGAVSSRRTIVDGKVIEDKIIFDGVEKDINSKEVMAETVCAADAMVHINLDNSARSVKILPAEGNKVRVVATAYYTEDPKFTDAQWFEKMNIKIQGTDKLINVLSSGINISTGNNSSSSTQSSSSTTTTVNVNSSGGTSTVNINGSSGTGTSSGGASSTRETITGSGTGGGGVAVFNKEGDIIAAVPGIKRNITIYLPAGADINITSKYTGVAVGFNAVSAKIQIDNASLDMMDVGTLKLESDYGIIKTGNIKNAVVEVNNGKFFTKDIISLDLNTAYSKIETGKCGTVKIQLRNASLDMMNAETFKLDSDYGIIKAGNIKNAVVKVNNGKFFAKDIFSLDLNTAYSKIETGTCNTVKMSSTSDDYDIDEVKEISGSKVYGSLRLGKLTGSIDLSGTSADIRIKDIDPGTADISITNKYADLRLPVTALKNYSVSFKGNYSKVYAPFDIKKSAEEKEGKNTDKENEYAKSSGVESRDFTFTAGDISGVHTKFILNCVSCSVDFK